MCEMLGISRTAFYRKCNGKSEFTQSEIQKIAEYLHLDNLMDVFSLRKCPKRHNNGITRQTWPRWRRWGGEINDGARIVISQEDQAGDCSGVFTGWHHGAGDPGESTERHLTLLHSGAANRAAVDISDQSRLADEV